MNFKKILAIVLVTLIIGYRGLDAQSKKFKEANEVDPKSDSINWSGYQGVMNWHDAKAKCVSLGMRLPTKKELLAAYTSGVGKAWEKDGRWYWTSEVSFAETAYGVFIHDGYVYSGNKATGVSFVRCIR